MKKFLAVVAAAALMLASNPAGAEILKNFRLSGQIDIQATAAQNVLDFATRQNSQAAAGVGAGAGVCLVPGCAVGQKVNANNDRIGTAQTRVLVHLDWDLLDDVHAKVTLDKNDRTWGTNGGSPQNDGLGQSISGTKADKSVLGDTFVDQVYVKIDKVAGQVDATLGRQFYGDSGDIVIYYGPSDKALYGLQVSALDAARFDWNSEWLAVTGVVAKQKGTTITGVDGADIDVRGLNFLFKGNDNFHASFYGWNKLTHATGAAGTPPTAAAVGGKNDSLFLVGLKAKIQGGGFWLKSEFDQNFGDNRLGAGVPDDANFAVARHYQGWATSTNAGFKAENDSLGMLGLWGEFTVGSGASSTKENKNDGFTAINGDYRPGSIYGRFAAIPGAAAGSATAGLGNGLYNSVNVGDTAGANSFVSSSNLSNRVIWGAGIKMSPAVANKLTLAFSWWDFRLQRFATIPNGTAPYMGNRHIGSEFDVDAIWTHSENVAFATGWGTFQPGGLIYEAAQSTGNGPSANSGQPVNPVMLAYFDVRVKF